jgi:hypothetical protein
VTVDDQVRLIAAIAAGIVTILGALGSLYLQLHRYQQRVDGRLTELLELTRSSAKAEGKLEGPDIVPS